MMTAPTGLDLKWENIPRELEVLDQWVGWRWKQIGEKWTKVPYDLNTGRAAASDDPGTWAPYSRTEGHQNIGFVFEDDPYCGIDLDGCVNFETGEITNLARQIIDRMDSYSEISPSGTGVKMFIKGVVPGLRRKCPKKNIEVYDRRRFFTLTGHHLPGTPKTIEARQEELEAFYSWLFPEEEPGPSPNHSLSGGNGFAMNRDLSDEDILSRACRAANGDKFMRLWNGDASDYESHSEADLALCAMLAFWTGPDPERIERMFSESRLSRRPKWRERSRYRRDTVAKALDGMSEFYDQVTGATLVVGKNGDLSGSGVVLTSSPPPLPEAPAFPTDALPGAARRFVEEGAEAIGCAPDLLALPVLAVLSAGIGGSRVVEIKRSWREGATLFLAVVASPGEKKAPAASAARRPVLKRQAEKRQEFRTKKEEHEREMREWKAHCREARSAGETEPPPPPEPTMERTYADDTTVESLVGILEDNPRGLLIYKDELTGWVRSHDQYKAGGKGADRQHWLSVWSNQAIVVDRKGRQGDPTYVERPWVSLVGGIQPAMLPELGGSMEDGLLDRFLFCYPKHSQTDLSDVEIGADTEVQYAGLYAKLSSLRMVEDEVGQQAPNVVPMSREARRLFKEIHDEMGRETLEPGFPLRLQGVWAKPQHTPDGRQYKERTRYTEKPHGEWIAVPVPEAGIPRELVERARAAIQNNERCSSAGRRFWELSGGVFRCAQCGRALVATTARKGPKERRRLLHYYQCATRRQVGKHACSFSRSVNAEKAEAAVWGAVFSLLTDPPSLRQDLRAMIERERTTHCDPDAEARAWAVRLAEIERKRERYQEMFAAEAMTLDELKAKLEALGGARETAEKGLALVAGERERLEAMERDADLLLESYAALAPEALDALSPAERRRVYVILKLTVEALADGGLKISGAFGEESPIWEDVGTSTR